MILVKMIITIGKDQKDIVLIIKKLVIMIMKFLYLLMQLKITDPRLKKLKKYLKIIFGHLVYL